VNDRKSEISVVSTEVKSLGERLSERIGQVDQKAQKAHDRLDTHLDEGNAP
jgi:hypothetical protein